jgi:predicted amidohydrolase YtcJ
MSFNTRISGRTAVAILFLLFTWAGHLENILGENARTSAVQLFFNGKVFTAEPKKPYAEAVVVRGDKIVAVGALQEAEAAAGSNSEKIDLQGRTLLPGFVDTHNHAVQGGGTLNAANVPDGLITVPDLAKFVAEVRRSGRGMNGPILRVTGIPLEFWLKPEELEKVFSSGSYEALPIYLYGMDYHTGWANRSLRSRVGLTKEFISGLTDDERKHYGLGSDLEPNGFAVDAGLSRIEGEIPKPTREQLLRDGQSAVKYLNSLGITAWMDPYSEAPILGAYRDLAQLGELTAHVAALPPVRFPPPAVKAEFDPFIGFDELRKEFTGITNLTIPGLKVFADGVAEYPSQTAAMSSPYQNSGKSGDLLIDPKRFADLCIAADRRGLIVHVHAIGDRAVTEALNGFATARKANGTGGPRHIVTHLQFVQPSDFNRFGELGVIASVQLYWASAGNDAIDKLKPYLDPGIFKWQYPVRSILHAGATLAGASDWPVTTPNVFHAIYQAETRRGPQGVLDAEQRMPREAMLYAYTRNAALALGQLDQIGSIAPGKQADLVLLDRDILTVTAEELKETQVVWTKFGGKTVFASGR